MNTFGLGKGITRFWLGSPYETGFQRIYETVVETLGVSDAQEIFARINAEVIEEMRLKELTYEGDLWFEIVRFNLTISKVAKYLLER